MNKIVTFILEAIYTTEDLNLTLLLDFISMNMKIYLFINIHRIANSFKRHIFNLTTSTITKRIMNSEDDVKQYKIWSYFNNKKNV